MKGPLKQGERTVDEGEGGVQLIRYVVGFRGVDAYLRLTSKGIYVGSGIYHLVYDITVSDQLEWITQTRCKRRIVSGETIPRYIHSEGAFYNRARL